MNRYELQQQLVMREVNPRSYYIVGVTEGGFLGHGELVLEPRSGSWVVYSNERGNEFNHRYFDNEDAAARYLFDELTRERPAAHKPTKEENERWAARKQDLMAEHRAWLREHGRDPDTGLPVDD